MTPLRNVFVTIATAFAVTLIFAAQGLVHAGNGMADGPGRDVALGTGHVLVAVTSATGITWPWNTAQAALGRSTNPATSPLLSAPSSRHVSQPASPHIAGVHLAAGGGVAVAAGAPRPKGARPPALLRPTKRRPLHLLVTGDSLTEFMGPQLLDLGSAGGKVRGWADTHYGTGLVRPDFVDWSVVARQQVAADHPEAVVVMIGGNDFQNMTRPNGSIIYSGTRAWTREYARRAEVVMRVWLGGGARRVYWLSMPPARDLAWSQHNAEINAALRIAAAHVPGAQFVDINGPITNHGQYSDFVNVNGTPTLVRAPDGIHLTEAGSEIVAREVLTLLQREWHF